MCRYSKRKYQFKQANIGEDVLISASKMRAAVTPIINSLLQYRLDDGKYAVDREEVIQAFENHMIKMSKVTKR